MKRAELDNLRGTQVRQFWHDASRLYNSECERLGVLRQRHRLFEGLDPSKAEPVTASAMQKLYNSVVADYKAVLACVDKSGNHSDFEQFVNGRVVALYLHLNIQDDVNVLGMVRAELPRGASAESSEVAEALRHSSSAAAASAMAGGGGKRAKKEEASVAVTVSELANVILVDKQVSAQDTASKLQVLGERVQLDRDRFQWEQQRAAMGDRRQTIDLWEALGDKIAAAHAKADAATSVLEKGVHQETATQLNRMRQGLLREVDSGMSTSVPGSAAAGRTEGEAGGGL
eukprot:GHVU01009881.1.p2 GENE.GHVU01009881.1~~GHVU01009881.1.p2  ORF type:complete len:287 (+),score=46.91 GHVU01009881.1:3249-4109(+)